MGNEASSANMSTQQKQGQSQQGQSQQGQSQQGQAQYQQQGQPQLMGQYAQQGQPPIQVQQQQMQYQPQQQQMQFPMQGYSNSYSNSYSNNNTNYAPPPMMQQQVASISSGTGFRLLRFTDKKDKKDKKDKEEKLKLAAVIVTICDGSTYDALFSSVKQDAGDGNRVSVYQCSKGDIAELIKHLGQGNDDILSRRKDDLKLLIDDLTEIEDASCVAFNYECCSGCNDKGFHGSSSKQIIQELEFFLRKGYLVMYSDFSLKAIIKSWNDVGDKTKIGPNPFKRTGDWSNTVTLNFNPYTLKTCVSTQLQAVGELCPDQDYCTVHCMGGTVKYSIKNKFMKENMDKLPYELEILTIAKFDKHNDSCSIKVPDFEAIKKQKKDKKDKKDETKQDKDNEDDTETKKDDNDIDQELQNEIDLTKLPMRTLYGDAGHVVLDYTKNAHIVETVEGKADDTEEGDVGDSTDGGDKNNKLCGKILLSMTHWCELVKLGDQISDDALFKVAAKNLGVESTAYQQMQATYASMGGKNATGQQQQMQQQWISQQANMMVQQQAPCNNMAYGNYSKSSYYKKGGY